MFLSVALQGVKTSSLPCLTADLTEAGHSGDTLGTRVKGVGLEVRHGAGPGGQIRSQSSKGAQ